MHIEMMMFLIHKEETTMRNNEKSKTSVKEKVANGASNVLMVVLIIGSIFLYISASIGLGSIICFLSAVTITSFKIPILSTFLTVEFFGGPRVGLAIWHILCCVIVGYFLWKKVKKIFD